MTDIPYPGTSERFNRIETRQDKTDITVAALVTTTAVHTEQLASVKDDMRDIAATFKDSADRTNKRIDRLLYAAWALFLVLLPIATNAIQALSR